MELQAERVASQQLVEQQQTAAALLGLSGLPPPQPAQPPPDAGPLPSTSLASAFTPPTGSAPSPALSQPPKPRLEGPAHTTLPGLPSSLEQLLERQWEQGSAFLMEQSQQFDGSFCRPSPFLPSSVSFPVASLLNCLHQLKSENTKLEKDIASLSSRKDHLLAVNARLSVPYSAQSPSAAGVGVGVGVGGGSLGSPGSQGSLKGSGLTSPTQRLHQPTGISSTFLALAMGYMGKKFWERQGSKRGADSHTAKQQATY